MDIMRKPKIYLETSIFNFVFTDDAPDKKAETIKLFNEIAAGKYVPFSSVHATEELLKTKGDKRDKMLGLLKKYNVEILQDNEEIEKLASIYIAEGMIPEKYADDALHIATASVYGLDIIASWNFKHIVKVKTITLTESINLRYGYKRVLINSPAEVIENE
jgi:predicted nucleic acid-binding protein